MWAVEIVCRSFFITCQPMPATFERYETALECDKALIELAKNWKPWTGLYVFNCREVKL